MLSGWCECKKQFLDVCTSTKPSRIHITQSGGLSAAQLRRLGSSLLYPLNESARVYKSARLLNIASASVHCPKSADALRFAVTANNCAELDLRQSIHISLHQQNDPVLFSPYPLDCDHH